MCGFAGEYLLDQDTVVDTAALERRAVRLRHRGPDAHGTWSSRHVGFSHVRLSLLDPENGAQPMHSARGTVLSYNGEIYNNAELRAELIIRGCQFHTRSDTEVLLAAYDTWGDCAWERLNGMFAFAIYDPARERLILVRDRLGIKPAFYRFTPRAVEFASEPSAWDSVFAGRGALSPAGVLHFLRFAQPAFGTRTLLADLKVLEPGTQLVVTPEGATVERWFNPAVSAPDAASPESEVVVQARLRHLLHLAVGRQMIADAPVGVFLSGGVDSAILTGLLAQMRAEPPRTYTIALEGDDDEFAPARAVAERWHCHHRERVASTAEFFTALRELIRLRHLPAAYPNEVLIYLLAREAQGEVKAVLTGEGADELFGGYTRILSVLEVYRRASDAAREGNPVLLDLFRTQHPTLDYRSDSRLFASLYSWFHPADLEKLLQRRWRDALHQQAAEDPFAAVLAPFAKAAPANRFHGLLEYAHLPNLLARLDGATMGASLEGRVPYTDTDLVSYIGSLPPALKYAPQRSDKSLLRRTFADLLPTAVQSRPKKPFDASLERLLESPEGQNELDQNFTSGPLTAIFDPEALNMLRRDNHRPGVRQQCWLLLSLGLWLNRNI